MWALPVPLMRTAQSMAEEILQREKETLLTRVGLGAIPGWRPPLHRSEAAEDVPFRVQNQSQCVRVPVAVVVKVTHTETIAAAAPQKGKLFFLEILKELRKVRNDRGTPTRRRKEIR
jgi:hypothetical protein